jgi:SAM-dependent methyltransferase
VDFLRGPIVGNPQVEVHMSTQHEEGSSTETERFYRDSVHGRYFPPDEKSRIPARYDKIIDLLSKLPQLGVSRFLEVGSESPLIVQAWTSRLKISGSAVVCIDVSPRVVDLLRAAGYHAEKRDISTESIPVDNESFDFIIASEVLEHLINVDHALAEFHRLLRSNGKLILTTPNLSAWFNRVQLLMGNQPIFSETGTEFVFGRGRFVSPSRPVGHLQLYTLRALRELLAYHKFRIEQAIGLPIDPYLAPSVGFRRLDRLLSKSPSLAGGLLIMAAPFIERSS